MSKDQYLLKKSVQLFLILFLIITPVVWLSLPFTNYQGDLTRIGKWSEVYFMGQSPQSKISKKLLISHPIQEADILVIGDSFSEHLQWQSVYQQQGIKVTTLLWSDIHYICENFTERIQKAGFRGKKIIIESIERVAARQIDKSIRCTNTPEIKNNSYSKDTPSNTTEISNFLNLQGQFIAGMKTIFNGWGIKHIPSYEKLHNYRSKSTHIYLIENGCLFFSHSLCNYGLFFYDDYFQPELDHSTIDQIKLLNKRINQSKKQYEIIWLIIPNKSSIYQRKISGNFWKSLDRDKLGPNLFEYVNLKKEEIIDLYQPNDTHFSNNGYLSLGRELLKNKNQEIIKP